MGGNVCRILVKATLRFQAVPTDPTHQTEFDAQIRKVFADDEFAQSVVNDTDDTETVCTILAKQTWTQSDRTTLWGVINENLWTVSLNDLSEHFSLTELTFSEVASRHGMDNVPPLSAYENLRRLCPNLLEPARLILGCPIHVNSGYRSVAVNAWVGGAEDSAHCDGRAADIVPIAVPIKNAFDALRTSDLPYDQIIFECAAWSRFPSPQLAHSRAARP